MLCYALELVRSEQMGDFERIYYRYRGEMMSIATNILRNKTDAEDAVQDALIRIAKNMERIDFCSEKKIHAFVLTVTRNAAIDVYNNVKKRQEVSLEVIAEVSSEDDDMLFNRALLKCRKNALKNALLEIPVEQAEVLMLRYVHELSFREIAETLNRTECTVRQQAVRGKRKLLNLLNKEGNHAKTSTKFSK